ncbi:lantibiotic ABC transporter permease [Streptococcus suis]|uniref:lantibiotic ABC transporter permease n=1 Tax=Streptococcus suis TaxID=1307 RepID=UPI0005CF3862|nr:lantibiotic ABC transporter permease [Streptococcus suis]NQO92033.1 lantibiotic ABC transporter permease [Streptococcus suis]NQQ49993.1 lantibiotic ABC transporter permease [Streptococcus suis]TQE78288.1 lantibiotic ABC transporter permease [Streptococcus suis]CYT92715.1 lantibiotic ABC transporter%2C membrane protein [Streptococcus suis]HEM4635470.1 lantibiotic ABC transporter permease [Streptococcus suis]
MKNIIRSEFLKINNNSYRKLLVALPLLAALIAFLLVGPQILESFTIYWWEALFLFALVGLLFLKDFKSEEKAGQFQNVTLGKLGYKIRVSKMILVAVQVFFSSAFLMLIIKVMESYLYPNYMEVNTLYDSITLLFMLLSVVWNIALLYYLSDKLNPYLLVVGNTFICLLIAPLIAQTKFWFIFPYTYHYKVAQTILHLRPSGDLEQSFGNLNHSIVLLCVLLSAMLTLIICMLMYRKKE